MGKIRRRFDAQFKMRICQVVQSGQQTAAEVCRDHQLSRTVVSRWLSASAAGPIENRPSVRERELERENEKLKAKVGELTMQVDVLKKTEVWKRRQQSVNLSVITASNLAQFRKPAEPSAFPSPRTTINGKSTRR